MFLITGADLFQRDWPFYFYGSIPTCFNPEFFVFAGKKWSFNEKNKLFSNYPFSFGNEFNFQASIQSKQSNYETETNPTDRNFFIAEFISFLLLVFRAFGKR
jgi:hypothetical protein